MPATDAAADDDHQTRIDALAKLHQVLERCYYDVLGLRQIMPPCNMDTGFAIGEAAGHLAKAKALVGRDIDDVGV